MEDNKKIRDNIELSKYVQILKDDVNLTISNLREKSLMCSSIWAKWLQFLYHEKENLDRIHDAKQKIILSKQSEIKNNDTILRMKSEEKLVGNDERIKKLNQLTKITQTNIDFIEHALNILQNFGFQIKNTTEILKLQSN